MSLHVLQRRSQIQHARAELRRRSLSFADGRLRRLLRLARASRRVTLGDVRKSWDILLTAQFIEQHVGREAAILDIGAHASEILSILHALGYRELTGIDLDPSVTRMPNADAIRYQVGDFMRTPFADASFGAVTAVSVIEHGFQPARLLTEMSRILRPGGYFIASFDYWPDKLDTQGIRPFAMDWCIFSRADVLALVDAAIGVGLRPIGPLALDAESPVIEWGARRYTFAWLALRKDPQPAGAPEARVARRPTW
jgi:SAM-dependent methyltransferase